MMRLLLSCEHGGHRIPPPYQSYFEGQQAVLQSHRGWDIGALELAGQLKEALGAPLFHSEVSRLLVELNRSLHHPQLFSEYSRAMPKALKVDIVQTYYHPYRQQVVNWIRQELADGHQVLHISVHSFTPQLNGKERNAHIGLLYDPQRKGERQFCLGWQQQLRQLAPQYKVRLNYPYRGTADGFTTALRKEFATHYHGIELEVRNDMLSKEGLKEMGEVISLSLLKEKEQTAERQ
jgi:predicted N-formylglutamate amidohydrolase